MRAKLIVFSGEQGCGKDTAIDHLANSLVFERAECKETLHNATMTLFGVEEEVYWDLYLNRETKNKPLDMFAISKNKAAKLGLLLKNTALLNLSKGNSRNTSGGKAKLSIREAMIYTSECVMKPMFGDDVFGVRRAAKLTEGLYLDGSFGFQAELQPAIDKLGQDNILGVRILGRRDGEHDSREILPNGLLKNTVDIWNGEDVSLDQFLTKIEKEVISWVQ